MPSVAIGALVAGLTTAAVTAAVYGAAAVTLGTFLIPAAITAGFALLSRALAPSAPRPEGAPATTIRAAVSPARWVLGRARVAGLLTWIVARGSDVYMVLVVSEGACDRIDGVCWVRGDRVDLSRTSSADGDILRPTAGEYRGKLEIHEFFRADGTQGAAVRAASARVRTGLRWTAAHRLVGKSFVLVKLTQPDYGRKVQNRFWQGLPELTFLVRGVKVAWPGQAAAAWTENATAIRWWWATERRGIPASEIQRAAFDAAFATCAETVDGAPRYTVNGVVAADDDAASVEAQLDFAWQGAVVEVDGEQIFRPGTERVARLDVGVDDVVAEPLVLPAPAQSQRANRLVARISQDAERDYIAAEVAPVTSSSGESFDGERLPEDVGTLLFVNRENAARRLMAVALRQARAGLRLDVVVRPGDNYEFLTLVPGDKVTVTLPELGFASADFQVVRTETAQDWSCRLQLQEWPSGLFDERVVDVVHAPRHIVIPDAVPAVAGMAFAKFSAVADDGSLTVGVRASWTESPLETRLLAESGATVLRAREYDNAHEFAELFVGSWQFTYFHVDLEGRSGPSASQTVEILRADLPAPPAPQVASYRQVGRRLVVVFSALSPDASGVELRALASLVGSSTPLAAVTDEAGWAGAQKFDELPALASRVGQSTVIAFRIPSSGRHRVFARAVSRAGRYSQIVEVGVVTLVLPAAEEHTLEAWPTWLGTLSNFELWTHEPENLHLLPSGAAASATPTRGWTGAADWPLGRPAGAGAVEASYVTREIDLGADKNFEAYADWEVVAPPSPAGAPASWATAPAVEARIGVRASGADAPVFAPATGSISVGTRYNHSGRYVSLRVLQRAPVGASLRGLARAGLTVREIS